jgi:hypothetical protein
MQYRYGFLARAAVIFPDGSFAVLGGGYSYLLLSQIPGNVSLAVVSSFATEPNDYGHEHPFSLEVYGPGRDLVVSLRGTGAPARSEHFPKENIDFIFVFNVVGMPFAGPGEYEFKILVDDRESGRIRLLIDGSHGAQP